MTKTASAPKSPDARREERRERVADLLLRGMTYRQIAAEVGCSLTTVHNDVHIVMDRWAEEQLQNIDEWIRYEDRRIQELISGLWDDARSGNLSALDRLIKLMERRAKLLGLDAPQRTDMTFGGGEVDIVLKPMKADVEREDG